MRREHGDGLSIDSSGGKGTDIEEGRFRRRAAQSTMGDRREGLLGASPA
jgi:hypothetical protein